MPEKKKKVPLPADQNWFFQSKPTIRWRIGSRIIGFVVTTTSQIWTGWLNTYKVHNRSTLINAVYKREKDTGLVTVSNHESCIDDPLLWGTLTWKTAVYPEYLRWILAAHDVCFTNYRHAMFFSLGQVVPVIRGEGVYQRSVDFILDKLNNGGWTHVFPEGKINIDHERIRYKWGVGRLVGEARKIPIVLPMYHIGMDDILPNKTPYIPRIRKKVTLLVGQPMEFAEIVKQMKGMQSSPKEIRKYITDKIQEEMSKLKLKAEQLHLESFQEKV